MIDRTIKGSGNTQTHFGKFVVTLVLMAFSISAAKPIEAYAQGRRSPKQYQPPAHPPSDTVGPTVIISATEDYRIGPSDVIEILVEDAPELSRAFRVGADGSILMPFLGRIMAQRKTTPELAKIIANGLRGEYLNEPQVTVSVKQINSCSYFIQGALPRPGLYQIEGRPSLLKLITVAGGLNENHGSTAFIIREVRAEDQQSAPTLQPEARNQGPEPRPAADSGTADNAKYEMKQVNINGLLRGNFDQSVFIEPGDIIYIPPADVFFVAGEVNAPGSFPLKDGTTLRQAISLSEGMTFNAAPAQGIIFRDDPSGKRQEIRVNIGAVMSGKKEDIAILANDIIIVPNSRLKSVTNTVLKAFGVNVWRVPKGF